MAYANASRAPFEFDDYGAIIDNSSLRDFWSFAWLSPMAGGGSTVSGRPVLAFTFAFNSAWGGLNVTGYHLVNLLIHISASLTLFGLVRRTLCRGEDAPAANSATWVALAVSGFWALHPLQTEAVTYIVQRAESLMALFYLLTFYCFLRGVDSGRRRLWWSASLISCLAGMGTKEVMVSAPVMLLLFDRAYVARSFRTAWRERRGFYLALASTWIPLLYLVLSLGGNRGGSTGGLGAKSDAIAYWLTQFPAVVTYLKLTFWPSPLVFEYGPEAYGSLGAVAAPAVLVGMAVLASAVAWFRWPKLGFLGLFFFAILAPTSLVPGTIQATVEHRMYLALAPLAVLLTLLLYRALGKRGLWALSLGIILLGARTVDRNRDYQTALALWGDTAQKRPDNARAHHNYALALEQAGRKEEAMAEFRRAIQIQPNHAFAHESLGRILLHDGKADEAASHFRAALEADPTFSAAQVDLGRALAMLGRDDEAISEYKAVLVREPDAVDARVNLAALLIKDDRVPEATALLRAVVAAQPELAEAHYHLGMALDRQGDAAGAEWEFREAVRVKPELAAAQIALGNVLARRKEAGAARAAYEEALRRDPRAAEAHYGLGNLLAREQNFSAAIEQFNAALSIDPDYLEARNNLANCQLVTGHFTEAISNYEAVLRARPGDQTALANLALARELLRGGVK